MTAKTVIAINLIISVSIIQIYTLENVLVKQWE